VVDATDDPRTLGHFNSTGGWCDGDYNFDGVVNDADVVIWGGTPCEALTIVSAVSQKTHGTTGSYDRASGSIEGRSSGVTRVVATFNQDIQRVNNNASDISLSSGTLGTVTVTGAVLTVSVSGVTDKAIFTIGFPGIAAECDIAEVTSATKCWKVLIGDANGTSPVNSLDILAIRGVLNAITSASNFTKDLNASGKIDSLDILASRGKLNNAVSGTCAP
jgi:hypothetical protein